MARIEEIYWLRFYGCIAVFCFHLLDRLNQHIDNVYLDLARIPTVLGTPAFIFISIFLFSVRYAKTVPEGFLASRVKYVMTPYAVYGLIYASTNYVNVNYTNVNTDQGETGFVANFIEYLIYAGWHGYFLIIATQFYAFYWVYARYDLERFLPAGPCLAIGSLISMAYWGLTRFFGLDPPGYLLWIAPLGWIYLFFLAVMLARHYSDLERVTPLRWLSSPWWLAGFVGLIVLLTLPGWLEYSSKEVWVVPLFILFTLCLMRYLKDRPATPMVKKINEFSFGIYLTHPLFFGMVDFVDHWAHFPLVLYTALLIAVGFLGSIGFNIVANRMSWGGLLFGKQLTVR